MDYGCRARCDDFGGQIDGHVERRAPTRHASSAHPLLSLQGVAGNRATAGFVQTKLAVGPVGDEYEQEADRAAGEAGAQAGPRGAAAVPAPADVESGIARARGRGSPLPADVRIDMERKLGASFGGVRVHTGPEASALNDRLSARAFTTGKDIFLRDGGPAAASAPERRLLAHELTHVVQQDGGSGSSVVQRSCSPGHEGPPLDEMLPESLVSEAFSTGSGAYAAYKAPKEATAAYQSAKDRDVLGTVGHSASAAKNTLAAASLASKTAKVAKKAAGPTLTVASAAPKALQEGANALRYHRQMQTAPVLPMSMNEPVEDELREKRNTALMNAGLNTAAAVSPAVPTIGPAMALAPSIPSAVETGKQVVREAPRVARNVANAVESDYYGESPILPLTHNDPAPAGIAGVLKGAVRRGGRMVSSAASGLWGSISSSIWGEQDDV